MKQSFHIENWCWEAVNQVNRSGKGVCPVCFRHAIMSQECETSFDDVTVLALRDSICVLECVEER